VGLICLTEKTIVTFVAGHKAANTAPVVISIGRTRRRTARWCFSQMLNSVGLSGAGG